MWNHARSLSLNQSVLRNKDKCYCSRKQLEPLMGLELTTYWLRVKSLLQASVSSLRFEFHTVRRSLYIPKKKKYTKNKQAKIEKLDDRNMFNFCFLSISVVILPIPVCHSKSLLSKIENSRKVPIFDGRDTLKVSYKCRSGLVMHSLKNNHLTFFSRIIKHTILVHLYKWSANLVLLNQLFMFILRL